jgi:hypothetical protein
LAKISKESGDIQKQGLFKHKGLHREESWKSIVSMFLVRKIDNDKVLLTARHPKGHLKFGILELNPKIKTN